MKLPCSHRSRLVSDGKLESRFDIPEFAAAEGTRLKRHQANTVMPEIRASLRRLPRFPAGTIVVIRAMLVFVLATTLAQAQPVPPGVGRVRSSPPPARESARQLAESIDVGDGYATAAGKRKLRRLAGAVVVNSSSAEQRAKHRDQLTAPGQPLSGYSARARAARGFTILEATPDEKRRQLQQPDQHRQVMKQARSSAGARSVNPVFVDPNSGLKLLATEQIVIAFQNGVNAKKYFGRAWKNVQPVWGASDQFVLTVPGGTAEMVFAEAGRRAAHPEVAWAEPDFIRQAIKCSVPNDPDFADFQWHLNNTGQGGGTPGADAKLPAAWDITTGTANIVIAILDDGVQLDHPDLVANIFTHPTEIPNNNIDDDANGVVDDVNGYDFFNNLSDPSPYDVEDNHGTAIAGLAAAVGNNNLGVAGAAYGCRILPLKVIEGEYRLSDSQFARALRYAAGLNASGASTWRGADVINISLAFDQSSVVSSALVDAAVRGRDNLGCSIMVSAGNGASAWVPYELEIPSAGVRTLSWEYSKDESLADGEDTVWLDAVTFPDGTVENFQGGGLPAGWSTSPSAPWTNVQEGVNGNRALTGWDGAASRSLRAGNIGNNQTTYVEVTRNLTPGLLRFWVWVSSERNADFFRFYVNEEEVDDFAESGVPLVTTAVSYPASHPACFAVGGSTDFDFRSDYSQFGIGLDFLAPSDGGASTIYTTDRTGSDGYSNGDYAYDFGGTSASSPLSAGVAALVLSVNSYLYSGEVRALLRGTCDQIGGVTYDASGRNTFYGSGRLNAGRAVRTARPDLEASIAPASSLADVGGVTSYSVTVRNAGEFWSGPFTLTNEIPAGAVFGSSTPATTNRTATRLIFSSFGLDTGEQTVFRVTVTNFLAGTSILTASVANVVVDSDPADNIATATNSVYPMPVVSIGDAELAEGNTRSTNALFNVSLSNPSAGTVTVSYSTATNSARSGTDFSSRRGKVTFLPGETHKVISVRVVSDLRNEADETFLVNLTAPVRATLGRAQGVGTILNDDPLPAISIGDVTVTEGNTGAKSAVFKLSLSAPSGRDVAVDFATASGSALAGKDFIATNGTLTFLAGKVSQKITVKVPGDVLQESNLTFFVNLSSPVNATLADNQGLGTIVNNDKAPKLSVSDVTVTEGDDGETNAVLTVRLFPASGLLVGVSFATTNLSATGGIDYGSTNGMLFFAPGETNQTISIPVTGDHLSESNEIFEVRFTGITNAVLDPLARRITILDDDPLPVLSVPPPVNILVTNPPFERSILASVLTEESVDGGTNIDFVVSLSQPSGRAISVKYTTLDRSARAGLDYFKIAGTLHFAPGVTNRTIPVLVLTESRMEPDEEFAVQLSGVVNATLGSAQAIGVILGELGPAPEALLAPASETVPPTQLRATSGSAGCRISFIAAAGVRYQIEHCHHLTDAPAWQPLTNVAEIVGTGAVVEVIDTEAAGNPQGFYRVRRLP